MVLGRMMTNNGSGEGEGLDVVEVVMVMYDERDGDAIAITMEMSRDEQIALNTRHESAVSYCCRPHAFPPLCIDSRG